MAILRSFARPATLRFFSCATPTVINVVMVSRMEEFDLGHTNAEAAYNQGATSADPPWVSALRFRSASGGTARVYNPSSANAMPVQ